MELSIFLAKLLGIYLIIITALLLIRKDRIYKTATEIVSSNGLLAMSGVISLVAGLAIIIGHPVWTLDWHGLITFIGVLAIAKGIIRFGFPEYERSMMAPMMNETGYWILVVFCASIGAFLTYNGFIAH